MNERQQQKNYGFALLERLAQTPNAVAFRSPRGEFTYGQLRSMIVRYAAHLGLRGIQRGSCVALGADRPLEGFVLAVALSLLGARWVRRTQEVPYPSLGVTHVVALDRPPVLPHGNFIVVDAAWNRFPPNVDTSRPLGFPGYGTESDVAFYAQSSGTTGRPKFIAKSFATVGVQLSLLGPDPFHAMFCAFPVLSSVGFLVTLDALMKGATMIARVNSIHELAAFGADRVMASPAQITRLIQHAPALAQRIAVLRVFGSMMSPQAMALWLQYFERIVLGYGSQEAWRGGEVSFTSVPPDTDVTYEIAGDVRVEIVDGNGTSVPSETEGIVRIRTPEMVHEYVDAPEATREAFRDGWFYPGDLGALTADGRLRVFGRVKDQFNFGGVKANAADIDAAANRVEGVDAAVSFARTTPHGIQELCVLAKLSDGGDPRAVAEAIRRECAKLRGNALVPRAIFFADVVPLNDSGKPARDEAAHIADASTMY
jgi:acyl-CoA synthetase (AMP-forming)/AMP-acid ligase II